MTASARLCNPLTIQTMKNSLIMELRVTAALDLSTLVRTQQTECGHLYQSKFVVSAAVIVQ